MFILSGFGRFLIWILMILAVTGGFMFRGHGVVMEVAQVDAFGVLFVLVLGLICLRYRTVDLNLFPETESLKRRLFSILDAGAEKLGQKNRLLKGFLLLFGFLFLGHILRHLSFETNIFDMNCLSQPLFFPFTEHFFHCDTCRMDTQFAEHMVWTLVPISLITQFLKSEIFIFAVQSLGVALPVWFFVRKGPFKEKPEQQFWFFILLALFSPLRNGLISDFREDDLAFGFFLVAFTFFFQSRWAWGVFFTFLVMATKENFPAVTFLFGLILFFKKGAFPLEDRQRRAAAVWILGLSITVFLLNMKVFIPYFMGNSESKNNILRLFPGMGNTMTEFLFNVLAHPLMFLERFAGRFLAGQSIVYLFMIFLPLIVWGRKNLIWFLPGMFMVSLNIMATSNGQNHGVNHYEFIILPFIVLPVVLGILQRSSTHTFSEMRSTWVWALALPLCLAGRGPAFEFTDRLVYLWDRFPAHFQVADWKIEDPLAADQFLLPQFNRVLHQRWLLLPDGAVPSDETEIIQRIVQSNQIRSPIEQGRDISDAKSFALDLTDPWEKALFEILKKQGGQVTEMAKNANGQDYMVLIQFNEAPVTRWCIEKKICQPRK